MTDQQLIDETAAAIAEELFRDGDGRVADVMYHSSTNGGGWTKPACEHRIAKHLTAMLAKREEPK